VLWVVSPWVMNPELATRCEQNKARFARVYGSFGALCRHSVIGHWAPWQTTVWKYPGAWARRSGYYRCRYGRVVLLIEVVGLSPSYGAVHGYSALLVIARRWVCGSELLW
jgi:hypothetical protein